MKKVIFGLGCMYMTAAFGQGGVQSGDLRGPVNVLPNGVIDGVVMKEEVLVRQAVQPEYVREADMVWSKRVFSRIDSRERINHELFYPFDTFDGSPQGGTDYNPLTRSDIDNPDWNKDQQRWSLWTIILRHIMLGDLTVFQVSNPDYETLEDGYSLRYPIPRVGKDDYFTSGVYRGKVNNVVSSRARGAMFYYQRIDLADSVNIIKTNQTFEKYIDSLKSDQSLAEQNKDLFELDLEVIKGFWERTTVNDALYFSDVVNYVGSSHILAYNIKEDWFFDKERSMLDRRIIAIAPVARYSYTAPKDASELRERGKLLVYGMDGTPYMNAVPYTGEVEENEMFWLYFPELRNVIVNYYVYNDQNDAQWMSMDDLFWKRKFNSTIYKVSDKFDREIQDYKYGVDALYEAERIKEEIRKWEHDVWNF